MDESTSFETLVDDIIDVGKAADVELSAHDVLDVAVYTLHSIVTANSGVEADATKKEICGMIGDDAKVGKYLFTTLGGISNITKQPELPIHLKYFYSISCISDSILNYIETNYKKNFNDLDLMNVAIFTLNGIVFAESDKEKAAVKTKLCGMVDDKYNLNEWLFTVSNEIKAFDETFYECIKSGELDEMDAKLDKAVKEANYKAWKDELKVIKEYSTAKNRIDEIKNGGANDGGNN